MFPGARHTHRNRDTAHTNAGDLMRRLTQQHITIPTHVTDAHSALTRHENRCPAPPDTDTIRNLYVDNATDKQLREALITHSIADTARTAWLAARADLGLAVIATAFAAINDIHPQLADRAQTHINAITAAAAEHRTIEQCVRDGDTTAAQLLADLDGHAAHLTELHKINDQYFVPPNTVLDVDGWDATVWTDPIDTNRRTNTIPGSVLDYWLTGIRNGQTLWYPSWDQAINRATQAAQATKTQPA